MPTPIPLPENFPVAWADPMESMVLWEREQLHFPHPLSPLARDIVPTVGDNLGKALRAMGAPVVTVRLHPFNTYLYQGAVPDFALIEGAEERMKASVAERGFTMYQTWQDEIMPKVEALSNEILAFPLQTAPNKELATYLGRTVDAFVAGWVLHFELLPGFYTAPAFKEACHAMFGFEGLEAYEMIQGQPNKSIESGSKLWHLAHSLPAEVRAVIGSTSGAATLDRLRETAAGQRFLADLDGYLKDYGYRTGTFDVMEPSWVERPELAVDQVRLMLRAATDPAEDQRRGAERAEALANECRAKLAGMPEALGQFEFLLAAARDYPRLQEDHNFYLDQKLFAVMRLPFVEAGRRLAAAGVIAETEDFAMLTLGELRAALEGDRTDRRATVAERRADLAYWTTIDPPLAIGSLPPGENPDPFLKDFFGAPRIEPAPANTLKGTPSSRGSATGTARVIRVLADADRVQEGDILVCEMTTPAWTPLFASLAAIVSDSGGPLSHCAVVAREYGVPCVTGTRVATRTIPDGARISVDGDTGVVRILG